MRGEAVAERVRRRAEVEAGEFEVFFEHPSDGTRGEPAAEFVDEKGCGVRQFLWPCFTLSQPLPAAADLRPEREGSLCRAGEFADRQPAVDCAGGEGADRREALFFAFAADAQ